MKKPRLVINQDSADIYIYDPIGSSYQDGVSPKGIADAIKDAKGVSTLNLRINSPGGDVFDGHAIYNLFNTVQKNVIVHVDGLAASAASVVAMAGDEIHMAAGAEMMIHRAWGMEVGFSDDLRKTADLLDQLSDQIADVYAARTGQSKDDIKTMMDAETWMTADDCMDMGFCTNITEAKRLAASLDLKRFKYQHAPKWLTEKPRLAELKKRLAKLR